MSDRADRRTCPACGAQEMYTTQTGANGGHGPALLPGLSRFLKPAKLEIVLCGRCGHVSFYATKASLEKLQEVVGGRWQKVR